MQRRVGMLIFPGFQLLDLSGPLAALEIGGNCATEPYQLAVYAKEAGSVPSSCGVGVAARSFAHARHLDTLLVAGGDGTKEACQDAALIRLLRRKDTSSRRVASICSGSYLLAVAGLLDGRRATTHWCRSRDFEKRFPEVQLQPDQIFVRDGKYWSSAGITAGIDLALALVEQDFGEEVAQVTARHLVVYYRRPGGQSQFSTVQEIAASSEPFDRLVRYIERHLQDSLSVTALAREVAMSPRHFSRRFTEELGMSPARFVERMRVERAQSLLRMKGARIQEVALQAGFGDAERMRRAFHRSVGIPPSKVP